MMGMHGQGGTWGCMVRVVHGDAWSRWEIKLKLLASMYTISLYLKCSVGKAMHSKNL